MLDCAPNRLGGAAGVEVVGALLSAEVVAALAPKPPNSPDVVEGAEVAGAAALVPPVENRVGAVAGVEDGVLTFGAPKRLAVAAGEEAGWVVLAAPKRLEEVAGAGVGAAFEV